MYKNQILEFGISIIITNSVIFKINCDEPVVNLSTLRKTLPNSIGHGAWDKHF